MTVKNTKSCINCGSKSVIKKGKQRGIIRYFCTECKQSFSSKRRLNKLPEIIFKKYILRRQVFKHLAQDYNRSIPWIRDKIFAYEPPEQTYNPRPVVIVCDATFYGKKKG
ncbi:MAG: hypothetical protein Q9M43_16015 [Sulfurimonas sp.]|nr:hypothetical protein [Sulfurimonas sp.]